MGFTDLFNEYPSVEADTPLIMEDINADNAPLVEQYNQLILQKKFTEAAALRADNPSLEHVIVDSKKLNFIQSMCISIQRMISKIYTTITFSATEPGDEAAPAALGDVWIQQLSRVKNAFAARLLVKTAEGWTPLFSKENVTEISLPKSGWTSSGGHYIQTVSGIGVTADMKPDWSYRPANGSYPTEAEEDSWAEIKSMVSGDGTLTFHAATVPTVDFTILLKGVV